MTTNPKDYQDTLKSFENRSILSINDFSKNELLALIQLTAAFKNKTIHSNLQGSLMASCFFEPSTRTKLSFESAMKRLSGEVIGFSDAKETSISKKETLSDTIKMVGEYADVIVLRHPFSGSARLAHESTKTPVINAGDGSNQHPTQTLVDLFTINQCQNKLNDLHIGFTGDLKYSRTIHSLVQACSIFNMRMYFTSYYGLELPSQISNELKNKSILFSFHPDLKEIIPKLDILYMTRIQEERMPKPFSYSTEENYHLEESMLEKAKSNLKILHALPRVNEIDRSLDNHPSAYYFEQAKNGLYLRQALLSSILGKLWK
ncbi:aspartate carbamoyltransferase [Criblamydia sequanensis]|uniref:Aspartate carbamoyltransferase n=1 Tax=Candidatus Criblamydia sequanensis CRIB-18 TaxID=1437425 RepID=A0A090CY08_9BACT|nr:aspartate carbamoyltransferase [Criblamydia sequanensis]CDR33182.1 Aspartate carbamoyltransferase, catalytic subunit [Criblamydia sequanensis CRIB-18]